MPEDQTELIKAIVHTTMLEELRKMMGVHTSWGPMASYEGLQSYLHKAAAESGHDAAAGVTDGLQSYIKSESFIDSIVDRINRKQVGK
jgi:hypothetical protein